MARLTPEDWEDIKARYVLGQESVLSIADSCGISHTAINKRAKAEGWQRLNDEIVRAAIDAKAALKDEIETKVSTEVSTGFKVSIPHIDSNVDRLAENKQTLSRVTGNMLKVADIFASSLAERAEAAVIKSVDDMKPFMAMSQLVNEAMKTPMKMVELETKQPEQNIEPDDQPRLIIQSNAIRD